VGKVLAPHNARPKTVPLIKWIKISVVLKIIIFPNNNNNNNETKDKTNKYIKNKTNKKHAYKNHNNK